MPLIARASASSDNDTDVTSGAIDTTGATLLVVAVGFVLGDAAVVDSYDNEWIPLTKRQEDSFEGFDVSNQLFYAKAPTVGAGHTFTATASFPSIHVFALSGVRLVNPFLAEAGDTEAFAAASSITAGPLTPTLEGIAAVTSVTASAAATYPILWPFQPRYSGVGGIAGDWDPYSLDSTAHSVECAAAWLETTSTDELYAVWVHGAVVEPTRATTLAFFAEVNDPPPVEYEDPCAISKPRVYAKLTADGNTYKWGVGPLRETADQGGFAEPRLLEMGPITRRASDPSTGSWSVQSASVRSADTDRVVREILGIRSSLRGVPGEFYLTSKAQSEAGGPPRVLFAGIVREDSADDNLVAGVTLNDLIGVDYSLFAEEKQIPQREIVASFFPNCPLATLGEGEPLVIGQRRPLDSANGEGVSPCKTVGAITIGATINTPDGTTLADLVAALQAAVDDGSIYSVWGPRLGLGDALALQALGTVPSDFDELAAIIGEGDLNELLNGHARTGGDQYVAAMIAGHATKAIRLGSNGDPSIWIDDEQVDPAEIGVSVWAPGIPGDSSWASTFGSDLFTELIGTDGTTRRYSFVLFDPASDYGIAVLNGARVHVDVDGMESNGDGTGDLLEDALAEVYPHLLKNAVLGVYLSGAWLPVPQFLFSDGTTLLDRLDLVSFITASLVVKSTLPAGRKASFTLADRISVREFIASCNLSWGCIMAQDQYQRLFIKVLDRRRTEFFDGHAPLRDKVDILPGLRIVPKPEWQANYIRYQYGKNTYTGRYERGEDGSAAPTKVEEPTSQQRHGVIKKTYAFPFVHDDVTANDVANNLLSLFASMPHVVQYARRGLCGLNDDLLMGVPITHYNGLGAGGWVEHGCWILSQVFQPRGMYCEFEALSVDALLTAEDTPDASELVSDPIALDDLIADDDGAALVGDA